MLNKQHINNVLFVLFFTVLGFFIGIYNYTPFEFQKTVNIVINPSILITVLLTYYVARTLFKLNEKEKQEKSLLISYFQDFQKQLNKRIVINSNFDNSAIASNFKFLRMKLHSSIKLASERKFIDSSNEINKKLEDMLTDIWELLSDDAHYNNEKKLIAEYKSGAENKMICIDELIFNIIIEINKQ